MSWTVYVYVRTNRVANADRMGADMMFDGMWLVAVLPLTIGMGLVFQFAWFWFVALFALFYVIGGFFAKRVFGK